MTTFRDVSIRTGPNLDAFGRLRVSNPDTQFDSQTQYDLDASGGGDWETVTTGSGSITHLPDEAAAELATTTASGDVALRQTHRYWRYRPGKSGLVLITGVFGAPVSNVVREMGYGDDSDGIFLMQKPDGWYLRYRSSASGSVVDTDIPQSSWNGTDIMDGTGPSGDTLDPTESVIFALDYEWLGVGLHRAFVVYSGEYRLLDSRYNRGGDTVYSATMNLPVRYRIENTAATTASTMKAICSTVISEGGSATNTGRIHSANNGTTTRSAASATSLGVITIRPKATFNSITNRALISPVGAELYVSGNTDALWEVRVNATLGGAPSYTSADTDSLVEYDVAATTAVGGHLIASGYAPSSKGGAPASSLNFAQLGIEPLALTLDYAGATADTLTLVAYGIGGTATVAGAFTWAEVR